MPEFFSSSSPEAEIKALEQLLQQKKEALEKQGEVPEQKEVFRQVFTEKYGEKFQPSAVVPKAPPSPPPLEIDQFKEKSREGQVAQLIQTAFEQGIEKAISEARQASPWLLDELHDCLIDEYYQKLIQAQHLAE